MAECRCTQTTGILGMATVPAINCPIHGVRAAETPRVGYKIWVEVERFIYDPVTGDESEWEDMALDLLEGAHIAEFVATDASDDAEKVARNFAAAFGSTVQEMGRHYAPGAESLYRAVIASTEGG